MASTDNNLQHHTDGNMHGSDGGNNSRIHGLTLAPTNGLTLSRSQIDPSPSFNAITTPSPSRTSTPAAAAATAIAVHQILEHDQSFLKPMRLSYLDKNGKASDSVENVDFTTPPQSHRQTLLSSSSFATKLNNHNRSHTNTNTYNNSIYSTFQKSNSSSASSTTSSSENESTSLRALTTIQESNLVRRTSLKSIYGSGSMDDIGLYGRPLPQVPISLPQSSVPQSDSSDSIEPSARYFFMNNDHHGYSYQNIHEVLDSSELGDDQDDDSTSNDEQGEEGWDSESLQDEVVRLYKSRPRLETPQEFLAAGLILCFGCPKFKQFRFSHTKLVWEFFQETSFFLPTPSNLQDPWGSGSGMPEPADERGWLYQVNENLKLCDPDMGCFPVMMSSEGQFGEFGLRHDEYSEEHNYSDSTADDDDDHDDESDSDALESYNFVHQAQHHDDVDSYASTQHAALRYESMDEDDNENISNKIALPQVSGIYIHSQASIQSKAQQQQYHPYQPQHNHRQVSDWTSALHTTNDQNQSDDEEDEEICSKYTGLWSPPPTQHFKQAMSAARRRESSAPAPAPATFTSHLTFPVVDRQQNYLQLQQQQQLQQNEQQGIHSISSIAAALYQTSNAAVGQSSTPKPHSFKAGSLSRAPVKAKEAYKVQPSSSTVTLPSSSSFPTSVSTASLTLPVAATVAKGGIDIARLTTIVVPSDLQKMQTPAFRAISGSPHQMKLSRGRGGSPVPPALNLDAIRDSPGNSIRKSSNLHSTATNPEATVLSPTSNLTSSIIRQETESSSRSGTPTSWLMQKLRPSTPTTTLGVGTFTGPNRHQVMQHQHHNDSSSSMLLQSLLSPRSTSRLSMSFQASAPALPRTNTTTSATGSSSTSTTLTSIKSKVANAILSPTSGGGGSSRSWLGLKDKLTEKFSNPVPRDSTFSELPQRPAPMERSATAFVPLRQHGRSKTDFYPQNPKSPTPAADLAAAEAAAATTTFNYHTRKPLANTFINNHSGTGLGLLTTATVGPNSIENNNNNNVDFVARRRSSSSLGGGGGGGGSAMRVARAPQLIQLFDTDTEQSPMMSMTSLGHVLRQGGGGSGTIDLLGRSESRNSSIHGSVDNGPKNRTSICSLPPLFAMMTTHEQQQLQQQQLLMQHTSAIVPAAATVVPESRCSLTPSPTHRERKELHRSNKLSSQPWRFGSEEKEIMYRKTGVDGKEELALQEEASNEPEPSAPQLTLTIESNKKEQRQQSIYDTSSKEKNEGKSSKTVVVAGDKVDSYYLREDSVALMSIHNGLSLLARKVLDDIGPRELPEPEWEYINGITHARGVGTSLSDTQFVQQAYVDADRLAQGYKQQSYKLKQSTSRHLIISPRTLPTLPIGALSRTTKRLQRQQQQQKLVPLSTWQPASTASPLTTVVPTLNPISRCQSYTGLATTGRLFMRINSLQGFAFPIINNKHHHHDNNNNNNNNNPMMISIRLETGRESIDTDYVPLHEIETLFGIEFCVPVYSEFNIALSVHVHLAPWFQKNGSGKLRLPRQVNERLDQRQQQQQKLQSIDVDRLELSNRQLPELPPDHGDFLQQQQQQPSQYRQQHARRQSTVGTSPPLPPLPPKSSSSSAATTTASTPVPSFRPGSALAFAPSRRQSNNSNNSADNSERERPGSSLARFRNSLFSVTKARSTTNLTSTLTSPTAATVPPLSIGLGIQHSDRPDRGIDLTEADMSDDDSVEGGDRDEDDELDELQQLQILNQALDFENDLCVAKTGIVFEDIREMCLDKAVNVDFVCINTWKRNEADDLHDADLEACGDNENNNNIDIPPAVPPKRIVGNPQAVLLTHASSSTSIDSGFGSSTNINRHKKTKSDRNGGRDGSAGVITKKISWLGRALGGSNGSSRSGISTASTLSLGPFSAYSPLPPTVTSVAPVAVDVTTVADAATSRVVVPKVTAQIKANNENIAEDDHSDSSFVHITRKNNTTKATKAMPAGNTTTDSEPIEVGKLITQLCFIPGPEFESDREYDPKDEALFGPQSMEDCYTAMAYNQWVSRVWYQSALYCLATTSSSAWRHGYYRIVGTKLWRLSSSLLSSSLDKEVDEYSQGHFVDLDNVVRVQSEYGSFGTLAAVLSRPANEIEQEKQRLEEQYEAFRNGFCLWFKDGSRQEFYADSSELRDDWVQSLAMCLHTSRPAQPDWFA